LGGPSANVIADITSATGAAPNVSNILGTSAAVSMASLSSGLSGADATFSFSTSPTLLANSDYALVLHPVPSSGTIDGGNNMVWRIASSNGSRAGCTDFDLLQTSTNSGASWANDTGTPYFYFVTPTYQSTGTGYWIVDGGYEVVWNFSTFNVSENPNGDKEGSVLYSIGVGSDPSTPSYSSTNITKAQVRALSNLTGQYLYVRVILNSANNNFSNSGVGSGSIFNL
jgi:hypothetical protein